MVTGVRTVALTYTRALWRRRWQGAVVAWLVCLAGWGFVIYLPDQYEAKARIYVDADSMLRPLMKGIAVDRNVLSQVDVMQRTLLSGPNLQKVSHMADLDLAAKTPAESEQVVLALRQKISVTPDIRNTNIFSLAYTGISRETAIKVVQSLLTVFVESNLGNSRKDIASARNFIEEQLRDYTVQLDQAERRVAEFKSKNIGFLPGENNYNTKLETAKTEYDKTVGELEEDQQRREAIVRQLTLVPKIVETTTAGGPNDPGIGPPLGGGSSDSILPDIGSGRVAELEQKLKSLRENYTDQHPDVVKTKRLLDEAKKAQELAASQAPPEAPAVNQNATRSSAPNPVYDQLQLQLVQIETAIASLHVRERRAKAEVEKWEQLAKSVPEVGAEMAKLTRDYDVTKKAYDDLLNRRESAKIGSDLETQTQTVQFRIVDPPEAPLLPVAPKRGLLLSVVLIGGIGAGVAFAFLLSNVDDSVMTVRQLKEFTTVPVLGAITVVTQAAQSRRRGLRLMGFIAVCVGLVIVYLGVISVETIMKARA